MKFPDDQLGLDSEFRIKKLWNESLQNRMKSSKN